MSLLLILAGCSSSSDMAMEDGTYGDGSSADGGPDGAFTSGAGEDGYMSGGEFGSDGSGAYGSGEYGSDPFAEGGQLESRVIYFEYDSVEIDEASMAVIDNHAGYLVEQETVVIRLEGHADERGSREYNIGLAERRAQAVRQVLMLKGADAVQITTVSYGEERPAVLGSDDEVWSLNRRVEIVYNP
jgi:peptidoglycan-associated lipoprotein